MATGLPADNRHGPDYNVGTIRGVHKEGLIAAIDSPSMVPGPNQVPASVIPPAHLKSGLYRVNRPPLCCAGQGALGALHNKTLFAKAGIAGPPKTMAQLQQDASMTVKSAQP